MTGTVLKSTGSWYKVALETGEIYDVRLKGKLRLKGLKATNPIAVGDKVLIGTDGSGVPETIKDILPRENMLARSSIHKTQFAHILAANVSQVVLFSTLRQPVTSLGFIDRCLVAVESYRIPCIIVFNKTDLLDEKDHFDLQDVRSIYENIGYNTMNTSLKDKKSISELSTILKEKTSVLAGHSGTGKSSLMNAINPDLQLKTNELSEYYEKGMHTTTFAEMHQVLPNSYVIDSPGIQEFGLHDISPEELSHYFPEMRERLGECKFHNCTHIHEPNCAIKEAVADDKIAISRYDSYVSMYEGRDFKYL